MMNAFMITVLFIALAAFFAFVLLLLWSPERPATRREVRVQTGRLQAAERDSVGEGVFGGGNAVWWAMFVIGALFIIAAGRL